MMFLLYLYLTSVIICLAFNCLEVLYAWKPISYFDSWFQYPVSNLCGETFKRMVGVSVLPFVNSIIAGFIVMFFLFDSWEKLHAKFCSYPSEKKR